MANNPPFLLVDTNAWVSYYADDDPLHQQAVTIITADFFNTYRLYLTNYVLLETITVLSMKAGLATAKHAATQLTHSSITLHQITPTNDQDALKILFSQTSKNLSFVDASILAILKSNSQITLFTFDTRLAKLARAQNSSLLT
jgi:predicted nucleic acid-binding protein